MVTLNKQLQTATVQTGLGTSISLTSALTQLLPKLVMSLGVSLRLTSSDLIYFLDCRKSFNSLLRRLRIPIRFPIVFSGGCTVEL